MTYSQKIDSCFESVIGDSGCSESDFSSTLIKTSSIIESIRKERDSGELPLFAVRSNDEDLKAIEEEASNIRKNFENLVILGTGGSTLSGQCLTGTKTDSKVNLFFMDNVDSHSFNHLFSSININKSYFLVISKSGVTVETLSQFGVCLKEVGEKQAKNHFLIITDPTDNPLRRIGESLGIRILEHEKNIGGRFSVVSNVGLLPACVAGMNIRAIRKGMENVINSSINSPESSEPAKGAALNFLLSQKNINITVLMPYCDRLSNFAKLQRQIWAESLGKEGKGTTPINASGTLDQHSQLQLYLDGPHDKLITTINLKNHDKSEIGLLTDEEVSYLNGKSLENLIQASHDATSETLTKNKIPVRNIEIEELNEETLGELIMHFILETVITAGLLNINAYNQPAVEEGKLIAKEILKNL